MKITWREDTTAPRKTFVMVEDPSYMVERWGLGSWQVYFDGYRISPDTESIGSRGEAVRFAVAHRDKPESKLARLRELTDEVLDAYEAVGHGARFDPDQAAAFRDRAAALS